MKMLMFILCAIMAATNVCAASDRLELTIVDTPKEGDDWKITSEYDKYRREVVYSFWAKNDTSVYLDLYVTVWQEGWPDWRTIHIHDVEPAYGVWQNLTRKLGVRDTKPFKIADVVIQPSL